MRPVVKRVCLTILLSGFVGGGVAALICFVFLYYFEQGFSFTQSHKDISSEQKETMHVGQKAGDGQGVHAQQNAHFSPPVPVSPPLVRPNVSTVAPVVKVPVTSNFVIKDLPSFAPLVRQVIPAVVNISISHNPTRPIKVKARPQIVDNQQSSEPESRHTPKRKKTPHHHSTKHRVIRPVDDEMAGAGSGFIVDPSGIIVTNRHVVGGAGRVMVSLSDGRSLPAHILGADPMTDIAVIKVESATALPCVKWGDSRQVEIGDWILVAGNPFGFGSSVTAGIVSAVGRDLGIGALDDFMQLDAPINPGNSGGPAFNLHGEVVAVNAAIASPSDGSVGIGFGIPAEIVAPVVSEIERTGHVEHGWLGVSLNDLTIPMLVEDVDHNGAAWLGGLRRGDAILEMGNVPVRDARTVLRSVAVAHPGTVFIFTIRRHGEVRKLSITLCRRPPSAGE